MGPFFGFSSQHLRQENIVAREKFGKKGMDRRIQEANMRTFEGGQAIRLGTGVVMECFLACHDLEECAAESPYIDFSGKFGRYREKLWCTISTGSSGVDGWARLIGCCMRRDSKIRQLPLILLKRVED